MWLDVVNDYHREIMCYHGMANVVADTLSCKATSTPIIDLHMRMTITSPLL